MSAPLAEPLYFGPPECPLFGWLHRPAAQSDHRVAVLICNPFGYEEICAHRSIKHLAEAAAAAGLPALRFDYDGSGNSAGTALDPARLEAWIASVNHAADALLAQSGADRLCVFGLRLGSTLAALAAARRADVVALVAFAPIASGRAYVRELRALQQVMRSTDAADSAPTGDLLEAAGFTLTAETQAALAAVDLSRVERTPAPNVLIIDRADLPSNERWGKQLEAQGAAVERRTSDEYVEMMRDAHDSSVAQKTIGATVDWLRRIAAANGQRDARAPAIAAPRRTITLPPETESTGAIHETALWLGDDSPLFGVLSEPRREARAERAPPRRVVLLVNSGAVHHVGPNRLYVTIARRWAAQGDVVLRFDVSGIGDSPPRGQEPENVVYGPHAVDDLRRALEWLHLRYGDADYRALGLCSGAYHAFKAAVRGLPLTGVIVINPLTFFWKEGMSLEYPDYKVVADVQRYQSSVKSVHSWRKLLTGKVNLLNLAQVLLSHARGGVGNRVRDVLRALHMPLKDDLGQELNAVAAKSMQVSFVFSTLDPGLPLLRTQGGAAFRRLENRKKVVVRLIDGADHTFTSRRMRAQLAAVLAEELDKPALPHSRELRERSPRADYVA